MPAQRVAGRRCVVVGGGDEQAVRDLIAAAQCARPSLEAAAGPEKPREWAVYAWLDRTVLSWSQSPSTEQIAPPRDSLPRPRGAGPALPARAVDDPRARPPRAPSAIDASDDSLAGTLATAVVGRTRAAATAQRALLQRWPNLIKLGPCDEVIVDNDAERHEANDLRAEIETRFGITFDPRPGVVGLMDQTERLAFALEAVEIERADASWRKPWTVAQLRGVRDALELYADILGPARARSRRAQIAQEITTFSRLISDYGLDRGRRHGILKLTHRDTIPGATWRITRNITIYDAATAGIGEPPSHGDASSVIYKDAERLDATQLVTYLVAHELGHGLLGGAQATKVFAEWFGWHNTGSGWTRGPTGKDDYESYFARLELYSSAAPNERYRWAEFEEPPTGYAGLNPSEDLAETAALYFLAEDWLKENCPLRWRFMDTRWRWLTWR